MTRQEFLLRLSEMLEAEPLLTGAEVLSDLKAWDSLSVINFIVLVEEEYGIVLPPKSIDNCSTINELIELVDKKDAE